MLLPSFLRHFPHLRMGLLFGVGRENPTSRCSPSWGGEKGGSGPKEASLESLYDVFAVDMWNMPQKLPHYGALVDLPPRGAVPTPHPSCLGVGDAARSLHLGGGGCSGQARWSVFDP